MSVSRQKRRGRYVGKNSAVRSVSWLLWRADNNDEVLTSLCGHLVAIELEACETEEDKSNEHGYLEEDPQQRPHYTQQGEVE